MLNIVLYEPEIAPNTGNIIRLASNTGAQLHLIEPLGFTPDDKKLRRAGLDYSDWQKVMLHKNFEHFLSTQSPTRLFTLSTHNTRNYTDATYEDNDYFLFGPETRGLPQTIRDSVSEPFRITLPMVPNNRSLNLSNSVAIIVYEAWRQIEFSIARNQ